MVEFSIVVLALVLGIFGIFEFAHAFYAYSSINNAAREAAHYGILNTNDEPGMKSRAVSSAIGLGLTTNDVNVTWPDGNTNAGSRLRVDIAYLFRFDTPFMSPSLTLATSVTMSIQ